MKNYIDYTESSYIDMKSQFFPTRFDCGCNPCHSFPPKPRPPDNCPNFCPSCDDELLYFLTGILIGKKWR